jgi:hypothetical protein
MHNKTVSLPTLLIGTNKHHYEYISYEIGRTCCHVHRDIKINSGAICTLLALGNKYEFNKITIDPELNEKFNLPLFEGRLFARFSRPKVGLIVSQQFRYSPSVNGTEDFFHLTLRHGFMERIRNILDPLADYGTEVSMSDPQIRFSFQAKRLLHFLTSHSRQARNR